MSVTSYVNYLLQTHENLAAAAKGKQLRGVPHIDCGTSAIELHPQPGSDPVGEILKREFDGDKAEKLFAAAWDEVAGNSAAASDLKKVRAEWGDLLNSYVAVWQDGAIEPAADRFHHAVRELLDWLPTKDKPEPATTIWYHGERSYSCDGGPVAVPKEQHDALQAFLDREIALETKVLANIVNNPAKVMANLSAKFPGAVRKPKKKGQGYCISVKTRR